jgi:hypothetical protein
MAVAVEAVEAEAVVELERGILILLKVKLIFTEVANIIVNGV